VDAFTKYYQHHLRVLHEMYSVRDFHLSVRTFFT
jgi:hypothetical protein